MHLPHRERLRDTLHYSKRTDPRRKKQQKGQTVNVLHGSEPDGHSTWSKRSWKLSDKPRIAPYKHTWSSHHNTVFWCNLKLAQRKGLRFYQTRSHAITLSDTLPAICIDKVVSMKTREELYRRKYKSSRLPRVTLVPNSQHVQKDELVSESRKSDDRENEVFISTGNLWQWIFYWFCESLASYTKITHNRNLLLKEFLKSKGINHFSRESKDVVTEMGNHGIFEFYETSSCSHRKEIDSWRKIDLTLCRFLDT